MCRVRVIQEGKVIGSLPSHNDGGYTGAAYASFSCPPGAMISMAYQWWWLDEDGRPAKPSDTSAGPSYTMEMFLVANGVLLDELSAIEGWVPERGVQLDPFAMIGALARSS
jgi:hypothetical protein